MISLKTILSVVAVAAVALAAPSPPPAGGQAAQTIAEVDPGSFMESIVTRPNGDLLATNSFTETGVYTVQNPADPKRRKTVFAAPLPGVNFLLGIAPVITTEDKEAYLVVGGNFSSFAPLTPVPDSWKAFKVAFKGKKASVKVVKSFPDPTLFLNGIHYVPGQPNVVLIADSMRARIGRLNIATGEYDPDAFQYPEMVSPPDEPLPVGVGSIKFRNGLMYFHNAITADFYSIKINADGTRIPSELPKLIVNTRAVGRNVDDFVFDDAGNIWFTTTFSSNSLGVWNAKKNKVIHILGGIDEDIIFASTSLSFGRTPKDRHVVYVTTATTFGDTVGTSRIVAVDTTKFKW
jgi:hypothetical protein